MTIVLSCTMGGEYRKIYSKHGSAKLLVDNLKCIKNVVHIVA